jgi:ABC-2 type transport system permease protein
MGAYLYIARIRFISQLAYRSDVVIVIISNIVMLLTQVFLWHSLYSGKGAVAGVNETQMITYAVISTLMGLLMHTSVQDIIVQKIVTGDIAVDFIKPINPLFNWMSDDIGNNLSMFCLAFIPIILISLLFKPVLKLTLLTGILLLPSVILSFAILWVMFAAVGLLAFWFMELGNLGIVQGQVIRILAGSFIPLWFFPGWVQKISQYLPFQYIAQFPLSICIGKLTGREIIRGIGIQLFWFCLITIVLFFIWRKAKKHVLVQGG